MNASKTVYIILGKILAVILILFCCLIIIRLTISTIQIGRGYVEVNMVGGEASEQILLNGETPRSAGHYYILSEQLYLEAPNGIAPEVRVGALMMHLTRTLPMAACLILICIVLISIARGRTFIYQNVKLLLAGGIIIAAAAVLAPVINGSVIPAIVNAASDNNLGVGVNIQASPTIVHGAALFMAAYVFKMGTEIKKRNIVEEEKATLN